MQSLNKNIIFSFIKTISSILFPLVTFPYITRTVGVYGVGEYAYATSVINYFSLVAGLGISTYAIREGARYKQSISSANKFFSEMFTINLFSTLCAYVFLFIAIMNMGQMREHQYAIVICSATILFTTIGINYIFNVYEDFAYITYRTAVVQLVSLLLLLIFIKSPDDMYAYMYIMVLAGVGANIYNWKYAKKYVRIGFRISENITNHLKPIFIIFFSTLSTVIYINSDIVMLGWLCSIEDVGCYAVASKLYGCTKSIINGVMPVFMVRLATYIYRDFEMYNKTLNYAINVFLLLITPIVLIGCFYSDGIILILSGKDYLNASLPMVILMVALIFATLGNILCSGGLLLINKENIILKVTSIGVGINVTLNYYMIPIYKSNAAAFSTMITEMFICIYLLVSFRKYINKFTIDKTCLCRYFFACVPFGVVKLCIYSLDKTLLIDVIGMIISMLLYFVALYIMNDEIIKRGIKMLLNMNRR